MKLIFSLLVSSVLSFSMSAQAEVCPEVNAEIGARKLSAYLTGTRDMSKANWAIKRINSFKNAGQLWYAAAEYKPADLNVRVVFTLKNGCSAIGHYTKLGESEDAWSKNGDHNATADFLSEWGFDLGIL